MKDVNTPPQTRSMRVRLARQVRRELKLTLFNGLINGVLGSAACPRPVRLAGYRALGVDVRRAEIFPGVDLYVRRGRLLSLGAGVFLNHGVMIEATAPVRIGDRTQIGHQASILTSHHPRQADGRLSPAPEPRPVTIGADCWIGARATILPGVSIGDQVVIAAGSVVTKDCLGPGVYAGVPARRLPKREVDAIADITAVRPARTQV